MHKSLVIFLLMAIACHSPADNEQLTSRTAQAYSAAGSSQEKSPEQEGWKTYENPDLNLSLKYPEGWTIAKPAPEGTLPVINIRPRGTGEKTNETLRIHAEPELTFISILPEGYPTELPFGKRQSLAEASDNPVNFNVNRGESKIFMLENDSVWGYFLQPRDTISGWPEEAFIFAQVGTNNFKAECYASGSSEQKVLKNCDPLAGDEFRRYGDLRQQEKEQILGILRSIEFRN